MSWGGPRERYGQSLSVLRFWTSEGLTQAQYHLLGWNSHVHRESTNLSRDNLSREMGRRQTHHQIRSRAGAPRRLSAPLRDRRRRILLLQLLLQLLQLLLLQLIITNVIVKHNNKGIWPQACRTTLRTAASDCPGPPRDDII